MVQNFKKLILFLINKNFFFQIPKKKNYVQVNRAGKFYLEKILGKKLCIIDINYSINIYILFFSIFDCIWKRNFDPYYEKYIDKLNPKFVFCFSHNYMRFYRLKKNDKIKYIAIQNGVNLGNNQFLIHKKKNIYNNYSCDYFFCFGELDKKLFKSVINAKFVTNGSFLSNSIRKKKLKYKKTICFISTFRNIKKMFFSKDSTIGRNISFDEFYNAEKILLNFLIKFCLEKNLKLKIIGSTTKSGHINEKKFYQKIFQNDDWYYLPKIDYKSSYNNIDKNEIACFIDSSLGYESLGRGNKVAAFSIRDDLIKINGFRFCRGAIRNQGPFWTSAYDKRKFKKILTYLIKSNDQHFKRNNRLILNNIINFDSGNKSFFKILKKYDNNIKRKYYYFN